MRVAMLYHNTADGSGTSCLSSRPAQTDALITPRLILLGDRSTSFSRTSPATDGRGRPYAPSLPVLR